METLKNLFKACSENVTTVLAALLVAAVIFAVAKLFERAVKYDSGVTPLRKMTIIALFSALSIIIMLFRVPVAAIAPSFYKLDFSEIPVLVCAFMLGPLAGVITEFIKIMLNLFINGTDTMFIGELANFIMGCALVLPASMIYVYRKTRKFALLGMAAGSLIMVAAGCVLNAKLLIPLYANLYFSDPNVDGLSKIIAMGTKINHNITNIWTFVVLAVAPFNLIKAVSVSAVTFVIYKKISVLLKTRK